MELQVSLEGWFYRSWSNQLSKVKTSSQKYLKAVVDVVNTCFGKADIWYVNFMEYVGLKENLLWLSEFKLYKNVKGVYFYECCMKF